jgi:hypothetical protein
VGEFLSRHRASSCLGILSAGRGGILQTIKVPQIDFGRGGPSANWSLLIPDQKLLEFWLHAELQKCEIGEHIFARV